MISIRSPQGSIKSQNLLYLWISLVLIAPFNTTKASELNISSSPVFLGGFADPNVMLTMDDSGSMRRDYVLAQTKLFSFIENPGTGEFQIEALFPINDNSVYGTNFNPSVPLQDKGIADYFFRSSENNAVFYDPSINYEPWAGVDENGNPFNQAQIPNVRTNPLQSSTFDILRKQTISANWYYERMGLSNELIIREKQNNFITLLSPSAACPGRSYTQGVSSSEEDCSASNASFTPITYYEYVFETIESQCHSLSNGNQRNGDRVTTTDGQIIQCSCNLRHLQEDLNDPTDDYKELAPSTNSLITVTQKIENQPRLCPENYQITQIWQDNTGLKFIQGSLDESLVPRQVSGNTLINTATGIQKTVDQEIQNFANWFKYYRSRTFTSRAAIGLVFEAMEDSLSRVGLSSINTNDTLIKSVSLFQLNDFLTSLYELPVSGGTPLRKAVEDVGDYFSASNGPWLDLDENGPVLEESDSDANGFCRQSFNILVSDGVWNGNGAEKSNNFDGQPGDNIPDSPFPDNFDNTLADIAYFYYISDLRPGDSGLRNIFDSDNNLAFWQRMVSFSVGFGIDGSDNVDIPADGGAPPPDENGNTFINFVDPNINEEAKIDDLWHAAINTTGRYLSARSVEELVNSLLSILQNIAESNSSSAAAIATNSGSSETNARFYQARFDASDSSGQLISYRLTRSGDFSSLEPEWVAGSSLETTIRDPNTGTERTINLNPVEPLFAGNKRTAYSYRYSDDNDARIASTKGSGIEFDWNRFSTDQQRRLLSLNNDETINNPQGISLVNSLLGTNPSDRNHTLGDFVHSSPVFVSSSKFIYPDRFFDRLISNSGSPNLGAETPHSQFRINTLNRPGRIYIGGNDGMLHSFIATESLTNNPDNGKEVFAYFPNALFDKLNQLDINFKNPYQHQFYVDATPTVGDAFFSIGENIADWHTVLAGGYGAGAQGIYAIDITSAPVSGENNPERILWEFSDRNDPDMGFSYSQPNIVRLHNGQWAVVFGNGYNSTQKDNLSDELINPENCDEATSRRSCDGDPVLFILDIGTGDIIAKLQPNNNDFYNETEHAEFPNGLSNIAPVDIDGDSITDLIYAGDLRGNLWRYDVRNASPSNWNASVIFKAIDEVGNPQPITVRPQVGRHENGLNTDNNGGVIVYFGTGKLIETQDIQNPINSSDLPLNAFYGIWDDLTNTNKPLDKNDLLQQRITAEIQTEFKDNDDSNSATTFQLRSVTDNALNWNGDPGVTNGQHGWYLNLEVDSNPSNGNDGQTKQGERVIASPLLRNNRIIFNTYIQNKNECEFGGDSWLMELDAFSGGRLSSSPFDFNKDGFFNQADLIDPVLINGNAGSLQAVAGVKKPPTVAPPTIVNLPGINGSENKLDSSASGDFLISIDENQGGRARGRQSWRSFPVKE